MSDIKWCWRFEGDDFISGPFDSRDEAIEGFRKIAYDFEDRDEPVILSQMTLPRAADYIRGNIGLLMDDLEDTIGEHLVFDDGGEGPVFVQDSDTNDAKEALDEALKGWARRYVRAQVWIPDTSTDEDVTAIVRGKP
jgi:hypothetical protein